MTAAPLVPIVVALGGNALIRPGDRGGFQQQATRVRELAPALRGLADHGPLVLTHGNGPQVGWQLLRSDLAKDQVRNMNMYPQLQLGSVPAWMQLQLFLSSGCQQRPLMIPQLHSTQWMIGCRTRVCLVSS